MKRKLEEFMSGRYGADQLSRFMLGICLVCLVLNIFTRVQVVYVVALVVLGICYYRMFSKDYAKRSAENQKYLSFIWKIKAKFGRMKSRVIQSKDYHIYKCPSCGQKIRIPRGKGKICVTCPKCRHEFEKRS
jgi:DNA-directed RNA polymerase subunit RPC12/RpoP